MDSGSFFKIPKLEDYNISPQTGFIPNEYPLERLSQDYYQPWENLMDNLPSLILSKKIRKIIDNKLPVLSTEYLSNTREFRRAYTILAFLTHAYVWAFNENPVDTLPQQISVPFVKISNVLELPPVATYASVCLWNFKPIIKDINASDKNVIKDDLDIDDICTINTFSGSIDESWFYLVSVIFEIKGGHCLSDGLNAIRCAKAHDFKNLIYCLQKLAESIDKLGSILMKMLEMCDPHTFYFRIRPFLAGWKNMKEFGLNKDGLNYGTDTKPDIRSYAGGSNAQSTLIQALDIILNVEHHPTGKRPSYNNHSLSKSLPPKPIANKNQKDDGNNFIIEMRKYMPGPHRRFLEDLSKINIIQSVVLENSKNHPELALSYDACVAMLKAFRDKHIQIVTRYIILQARLSQNGGSLSKPGSVKTLRVGLASKLTLEEKGTGGTSLLPFLKQCRDETGDSAAGSWGRRILSSGVQSLKYTTEKLSAGEIKKRNKQNWGEKENAAGHW
ncbi:dioxygenase BNA2 [Ascoidea rubescens DSM 1968]|uniref:Indoleamine 2,3-dioxygenase n=1 Tax=Ascoidea rubescens DSM 1968 TaxID=1344418 RepID=A0A1D2VLD0_9ASCO|nr:tryptophan 2,3 dioxygenase [Ascoidea rubescens DSM 1968]ODV62395.1 tryptophan 2,3 dioxygenase [Ascoidea rubescens DSM 1968]